MVIETGKEPKEVIEEEVREGVVRECSEYDYLGFWVNKEGNCLLQIEEKAKEIKGEIAGIMSLASYHNVGATYINVRLQLYESCILKSLLYDLEGWNKLSKKEVKKLESIQQKSLCTLLGLPKTTPYVGLLNEVGIWTIEERLKYRKIMLYQNLLQSDDRRLAKNIVVAQKEGEEKDTFYATVKTMTRSLDIDVDSIDTMSKEELKKEIKKQIGRKMVVVVNSQLHLKKMRFVKEQIEFKRKKYIEEMDASAAVQVLKTRLNMLPIYGNYKGDLSLPRPCPLCKLEDDTTEHMVMCKEIEDSNLSPENLMEEDAEMWTQINEVLHHNIEKRKITGGKMSQHWSTYCKDWVKAGQC